MPNWIQVQAWYDTESGRYYMGAQPPTDNQQIQSNQVIAGQGNQTVQYRQPQQQIATGQNTPRYYQQQVPYMQPQQNTYYNPGGVPTNVVAGMQGRPLVQYNYQPQQVAWNPNTAQAQYEYMWSPAQGRFVAVRNFNLNNYPSSGAPVRMGTSPDGQVYGSNTQTVTQVDGVTPTTPATTSTTTKRNTRTTALSPEAPPSSSGAALGEQIVNDALGVPTVPSYEPLPSASATTSTTSLSVPSEVDPTTLAIYTERIRKEEESKANSLQNVVGASPEDVRTLSDEEILREALRRIKRDNEALREAEKNTSVQYVGI